MGHTVLIVIEAGIVWVGKIGTPPTKKEAVP
jgi:hypothetical protein